MQNIWTTVKDRILEGVFGNEYEKIYDLVNNYGGDKIEFELRLADTDSHCGVEFWNIYNQYLTPYTDLRDDVILSCANESFDVHGKVYRYYKYGGVMQEKTLISKFGTIGSSDIIPLIAKVSREINIPVSRSMIRNAQSYARTYRTCYNINFPLLSDRASRYLSNWSVDKTVRLIANDEKDYKIQKTLVKDISSPISYDILDIEFEYIGMHNDFEQSLLSLLEFLYLAHPLYKRVFKNVSFEYQIYNSLSGDKLSTFLLNPEVKQYDDVRSTYSVPEGEMKLMIFIDDSNWISMKKNVVNLENFKDFDTYNFSILNVWECKECKCRCKNEENEKISKNTKNEKFDKFGENNKNEKFDKNTKNEKSNSLSSSNHSISSDLSATSTSSNSSTIHYALDIYFCNKVPVYNLPYKDRLEYLKSISTLHPFFTIPDEGDTNTLLMLYDDYTRSSIIPSEFRIRLKMKLNSDEHSYALYTNDGNVLSSSLLLSSWYTPKARNSFELSISTKESFVDNEIVEFGCVEENGFIELIPERLIIDGEANDLRTSLYILLEAYAREELVDVRGMKQNDAVALLFQYTVEQLRTSSYRNILLYAVNGGLDQNAIKVISNYIMFDRLIVKGTSEDIVANLSKYYSPIFISPVIHDTRLVQRNNNRIYTLNESQELHQISSIFTNDIDVIITSFNAYKKVSDLVSLFNIIHENITKDAIVVLNYINTHVNIYNFMFDIDREMNASLIKRIESSLDPSKIGGGNYAVDCDMVKDLKSFIIKMRKRPNLTLFRSSVKLNAKDLIYVGDDAGKRVYKMHDSMSDLMSEDKTNKINKIDKSENFTILNNANNLNNSTRSIETLKRYIISELKQEIKRKQDMCDTIDDITLFVIRILGAYFDFNSQVSYPMESEDVSKIIAFQKNRYEQFADGRYRDYISCRISF